MNILVMGGTKFFGRRLVHLLLEDNHEVTIATRGQTSDDFGDKVQRIQIDRADSDSMIKAFEGQHYDLVYDQICFDPKEAKIAVEAFGDRVSRYIFTSSMAVYQHNEEETTESDFHPENYSYDLKANDYSYDEGKRQAEAYLYQHAKFSVVAVRVALVVSGNDDYTGRFDYYVSRVANGESIGVLEKEHPITYVTAWDITNFLRFIGMESDYQGPINAGNSRYLSIQEFSHEIGKFFSVYPRFHVGHFKNDEAPLSPYAIVPYDYRMSNAKARSLGYEFPDIKEAIPLMVEQSAKRLDLNI